MPAAQAEETVWTSRTGLPLFSRWWRAPAARATLILLHGFAEHSGRYDGLAAALTARGFSVFAPDLRGHGRSGGHRGDVAAFDEYLEDLTALTDAAALAAEPSVLFGHSYGGLIAVHWALAQPQRFRALCLQSPLFGVAMPIPRWKTLLAKRLRGILPQLALPSGIDPDWLSHDPAVTDAYRRDPLVHGVISLRGYFAMLDAMRRAMEQASKLAVPTLVLRAEEDQVVSTSACRAFVERLACERRCVSYPGCYHELHHEVGAAASAVEELTGWIQAHL